jgi:small subunit ribosomal protein S6
MGVRVSWHGQKSLRRERASPFINDHREVKTMTKYEVMFVIDPTLEDEKKEATIETVKEIIAAQGTVSNVDVWGMRKLAYPIEKKNEGYYVVAEFEAEPTLPKELDRRLRISDNVMRHIIINKDEE